MRFCRDHQHSHSCSGGGAHGNSGADQHLQEPCTSAARDPQSVPGQADGLKGRSMLAILALARPSCA